MGYALDLAKFLESIMDDLIRRGEKKQIYDSLLEFHKYVKESVIPYLFFESTAKKQQFFDRLALLTVAIGRMKMIAWHYNDVINQKTKPEDFLNIFKKHNPVYVGVPNAMQRKADPRLPISFEERGDGQYLAIREFNKFLFNEKEEIIFYRRNQECGPVHVFREDYHGDVERGNGVSAFFPGIRTEGRFICKPVVILRM